MSDLIDRQAAIDLVEGIETERLKGNIELIYAPAIKGLRALPSAQPEITETQVKEYCEKRCLVVLTFDAFQRLKSAPPERKKGKWIVEGHHPNYLLRCSTCQEIAMWAGGISYIYPNFCPKCGAEMENADERFNQ